MITGEFDEEILQDLINEGYEGSTLLEKFKEIRVIEKFYKKIPSASVGGFFIEKNFFTGKNYSFGTYRRIFC